MINHSTVLEGHSLYIWPAQIIQSYTGECPSNSVECLLSHHQLTKTYNRLSLANPTNRKARHWSSLPAAQNFTGSHFRQSICSAQSIKPSLSAGDETLVPIWLCFKCIAMVIWLKVGLLRWPFCVSIYQLGVFSVPPLLLFTVQCVQQYGNRERGERLYIQSSIMI